MGALSLSGVAAAALDGGPLAHVTATYYGLFVLGCLAAALAFRTSGIWPVLRERIPWGMAAGALAVCICAFCHGRDIGQVTQLFPFLDYAVGLAAMCLLVRAAIPENASEGARPAMPNRVAGVLGTRPLAALGTFAYSLYLVHAPLLQVVYVYVVRPMGRGAVGSLAALIGIGTPLIVGAAYLFYLIFERPFVGQSVRRAAAADTSAIAPDAV
jgi:peptidoglycan/LPS O-acetylase OafA/YrhL